MSKGFNRLHSHSVLERSMFFPKDKVLVDMEYADRFLDAPTDKFTYNGIEYLKVPTLTFFKRGGVFKAFDR